MTQMIQLLKDTALALAIVGGVLTLYYFDDDNCTTDSECIALCESRGGADCTDEGI